MDSKVIDSIAAMIGMFIDKLGPGPTIFLFLFIVGCGIAWIIYKDRRSDRDRDALVAEKERNIQALAGEVRVLKIQLALKDGLTLVQAERLFAEDGFASLSGSRSAHKRGGDG